MELLDEYQDRLFSINDQLNDLICDLRHEIMPKIQDMNVEQLISLNIELQNKKWEKIDK